MRASCRRQTTVEQQGLAGNRSSGIARKIANRRGDLVHGREVAERDPHNMYAQMMLGIGGVMTGQFDKAIDRFKKVIDHQPGNLEAILNLAEAYEQKGDKGSAIQWYERSKQLIKNPEIQKELDARINSLR